MGRRLPWQITEDARASPARRRVLPGRTEWLYRSVHAVVALFSPQSATVIARTGVAVFSVSLLLPMFFSGLVARASAPVIVAATTELALGYDTASVVVPGVAYQLPPLPDPIARPPSLAKPTPSPQTARVAATGGVVIASWYGPGFYENRLPCWQWLKAQGLPIQFLPDTWGVAHKSLPCGTMITLTHGTNTVTVPVVDRGPYIAGRELDLSPRVKAALGCTDLCTLVMQIR